MTNVPVAVMPAAEVIAKYHDLWHVEKSFRMSKSDLRGPADVPPHARGHRSPPDDRVHRTGRLPRHPIAHRPGPSPRSSSSSDRCVSATININGATQTFPPAIPTPQREILDRPRHQTGVLGQMSKVRLRAL